MEKKGTADLYKKAGVDIDKGDSLVEWLQETRRDFTPYGEIVSGIGGFAALFRPDFKKFKDPLLISTTDGVGTKVLLGIETKQLFGLGIDLVAMCANDLFTLGGMPLFFLDYYATGHLDSQQFKEVLSGIKEGVAQCRAALLGGETAELPGLYQKSHFDLAGFLVGVVDSEKVLGPKRVKEGALLYSFQSSGFHSNGFSLIRHWLKQQKTRVNEQLLQKLLEPTKIYHEIPDLLDSLEQNTIFALANITGGGISGNLCRVIPENLECQIEKKLLPTESWMKEFISSNGGSFDEVEPVFNLGAGMIGVIDKQKSGAFEKIVKNLDLGVKIIGEVRKKAGNKTINYI